MMPGAAMRSCLPAAVTVVVAAIGPAALAASAPFADAPAGLREEVVLAGSVVRGGRLEVRRFVDVRTPETLHEAVRSIWSRRAAPVHSSERDGWLVLTQLVDSAVETFEVRRSGPGSTGRRARLSRPDLSAAEVSGWLEATLPQESRTIDRVIHADGGRQMTTIVALTPVSAVAASREVVSALLRLGFAAGHSRPATAGGRGVAAFLVRGSEDIALTVSEHEGQRAVVMHWGRSIR